MPDCVGEGPVPVVVGGGAVVVVVVGFGEWPIMLTQTYASAQMPPQVVPTVGFHLVN
jgi:hypothetical protein